MGKQPPSTVKIDWTNPLAKKLGFLWIGPHTGGPYGRDLVSGVEGVDYGAFGIPVERTTTDKGHAVFSLWDNYTDKNTVRFHTPPIPRPNGSNGGICFTIINKNNNTTNQVPRNAVSLTTSVITTENRHLLRMIDFDGRALFWISTGGTGGLHYFDDVTRLTDTNWNIDTIRKQGTGTNTGVDWFANNSKFSSLNGVTDITGETENVFIANDPLSSESSSSFFITFLAIWKEHLTDTEIASLHKNPWQLCTKRRLFAHTYPYDPTIVLEEAGPTIVEGSISFGIAQDTTSINIKTTAATETFSIDLLDTIEGTVDTGTTTLTITLVDSAGTPLANLSGLSWAWFDESAVNSATSPPDVGTGATTDSSGQFSVSLPNTTLTSGQTGMLALQDSTGFIYAIYRITLA